MVARLATDMIDAERCASSLNERSDYNQVALAIYMASKITYWKCVDCSSMINDDNMVELDGGISHRYASMPCIEFCQGCFTYNPEVVLAYA